MTAPEVRKDVLDLIESECELTEKEKENIKSILIKAPIEDVQRVGNMFLRFGAMTVMEIVKERSMAGEDI